MLVTTSQFLLREAIRKPELLFNPPILESNDIILPRLAVVHDLDLNNNNHFVSRDHPYYVAVPNNKRIPIHHITDLTQKTDTVALLNKYVAQEVRRWTKDNLKKFRLVDLLESPNSDINVVSIFNYNLLKDLYKYKTTPIVNIVKFRDLFSTYFHYVKEAVKVSTPDAYHIVPLGLPPVVPSYIIMNKLLTFNDLRISRIIISKKMLLLLEFYKWLDHSSREKTVLKEITDEDSLKIILHVSYLGYSTFLPLSVIVKLLKSSPLEHPHKYDLKVVQRLFMFTFIKFKATIDKLIEKEEEGKTEEITKDENVDEKGEEELKEDKDEDVNDNEENISKKLIGLKKTNPLSDQKLMNLTDLYKELEIKFTNDVDFSDLEAILEEEEKSEESDITDEIYAKSILEAEKTTEEELNEPLKVVNDSEHLTKIIKDETLDDKIEEFVKEAKELKLVSPNELRTLKRLQESRKLLKSPYDPNKHIDEFKKVTQEEIVFSEEQKKLEIDNPIVPDDLKEDHIKTFDEHYITKVMRKDIVACVTNLEKNGIILKEYEVEEDNTALGQYEIHRLTLKPIDGKESTIYMRLPKVNKEGEFLASGVKVRMRKQRTDLPIRKISPTKVAITSNYGKIFIQRTERKTFNDYQYLVDYIKESYLEDRGIITNIKPGNNYDNTLKVPNLYANLSMHFVALEIKDYSFNFKYKDIGNYIDESVQKDLESKNLIFVGHNKQSEIIVMDYDDNLYNYSKEMEPLGNFYTILEVDESKVPKPFSTINILGDQIPLGVVLAYYIGLSNLIALTGANYKYIEANKQYKPTPKEIVLKFEDYKLIIEPKHKEHYLLFNGFFFFKDFLKDYLLSSFDDKEIYLSMLEYRDYSLMYIKELNLQRDLFLDPITVNVLESMNEPTDYIPLLLRANELLKDFNYPDVNDPNYSRIRGYDRVPGLMYRALSEAIREYRFKGRSTSKIELDPYKVWNYVTRDNTVKICEDNNPITDLKEMEVVTLTGQDGLSKDATPPLLRRYHKNDVGLISEATVDSGDVGLNFYLTPYAKFKDLRGTVDANDKSYKENPTKIFSTSVALVPFIEHDDPKRISNCPF